MGAGRLARTSPREAIGIGLREGGEPREPAATEDGMTRDRAAKFLPLHVLACVLAGGHARPTSPTVLAPVLARR